MTPEESLTEIGLTADQTKEDQQSAFYKLQAQLQAQISQAPTELLKKRLEERLEKVR